MTQSKTVFRGPLLLLATLIAFHSPYVSHAKGSGKAITVKISESIFMKSEIRRFMGERPELRSKISEYLKKDYKGSKKDTKELWEKLRDQSDSSKARLELIKELNNHFEALPDDLAKLKDYLAGKSKLESGKIIEEGKFKAVDVEVKPGEFALRRAKLNRTLIEKGTTAGISNLEIAEAMQGAEIGFKNNWLKEGYEQCVKVLSGAIEPIKAHIAMLKAMKKTKKEVELTDNVVEQVRKEVYPDESFERVKKNRVCPSMGARVPPCNVVELIGCP